MSTPPSKAKSIAAMQAARAYLKGKPSGSRTSKYREKDAGDAFGVCERTVKKGVALLTSERRDLVIAVKNMELSLSRADQMRKNGQGLREGSDEQWLYLITEAGTDSKWSKIGVGDLVTRFDEAQRGNPRKLRLAGAWWFPTDSEAREVKEMLKEDKKLSKAPGGNEWREGLTPSYVNDIADTKRGRRSLAPGFNRMGFRRMEGSSQLLNNQHRQAMQGFLDSSESRNDGKTRRLL